VRLTDTAAQEAKVERSISDDVWRYLKLKPGRRYRNPSGVRVAWGRPALTKAEDNSIASHYDVRTVAVVSQESPPIVDHVLSQSYWEKLGNASQYHQKADRQISYPTIGTPIISVRFNDQGRKV
jgi:hypothetical protein